MHQTLNYVAPDLQCSPEQQEAIDFLKLILPAGEFYYATSYIGKSSGNNWRDDLHSAFPSMVQRCFALSNTGNNTYFGLSAFNQSWHTVQQFGGKTKSMFRTQENAVFQKALWLDIDCGKNGSPYSTAMDIINALKLFIQKTGLPLPTVVCSGNGVHLYWPFTEAVDTKVWRIMAGMLKATTVHFGFSADHSRTTDAASVLRLPGTFNYGKDNITRPVLLQLKSPAYPAVELGQTLLKLVTDNNILPNNIGNKNKITQGLKANTHNQHPTTPPQNLCFNNLEEEFQGPLRHPLRIIQECKQIQSAGLGTYTQWYNMMLVMKHCVFGEQAIHDISKMDTTRYDVYTVQDKLQQAIDGGYGPCRCDTFNEKDPGICEHCPYWGKINTPLLLGAPYVENKPVSIPIPEISSDSMVNVVSSFSPLMQVLPFSNKEFSVVPGRGIVWHKKELVSGESVDPDEEVRQYITKDILLNDTEIYIHSICVDTTQKETKRSYVIRKQSQGKAAEDIMFDITSSLGQHQMLIWLTNNGMMPTKPKYNKQMSDFMSTYIAAIQNKLPEIFIREHFGWVKNHDRLTGEAYDGFIIGNTMHSIKGPSPVKLTERASELATKYMNMGTLESWLPVPQMYRVLNQPFPMLMMLNAFGAPFMKFGPGVATNLIYNIYEIDGGRGKSTVLRAAASVWGSPNDLLMTKSDTHASRFQHYAVYKNLPILIDEITNMGMETVSDLAYDIGNGREKSRSTSSGTGLAKSGTWQTLTMCTSNTSLYELLKDYKAQSNATCMRVIEMQCDFINYSGRPEYDYINNVIKLMDKNYGHAGPAFMSYILKNPNELQGILDRANNFVSRLIQHSDERFWAWGAAFPLAVNDPLVNMGILDYNTTWMEQYVGDVVFPTIRDKVKAHKPSGANLLADFLNEHLGNTLSVATAVRPAEQPDPGIASGIDPYVKAYPIHSILIRHEADTNTYIVASRAFSRWLGKNGLSLEATLQDLELRNVYQKNDKTQVSLGSGVSVIDRSRTMAFRFILPQGGE